MAIALGSLLASLRDSSNVSSYVTASFTPEANALIIAAVEWSDASAPGSAPTVSGGSLTWSSINDQVSYQSIATPLKSAGWYWAAAPGSPGSMTVTADFGGTSHNGCAIDVFSLTGANNTSPRVQGKTNSSDSTATMSQTLDSAPASTSAVICFGLNTNNNGMNAGTGFTELADAGYTTPTVRLQTQYMLAPANQSCSCDKTGGGAGVPMAIILAEIAIAAAGGGGGGLVTRKTLLGVGL